MYHIEQWFDRATDKMKSYDLGYQSFCGNVV